jgi:hypothetical protein
MLRDINLSTDGTRLNTNFNLVSDSHTGKTLSCLHGTLQTPSLRGCSVLGRLRTMAKGLRPQTPEAQAPPVGLRREAMPTPMRAGGVGGFALHPLWLLDGWGFGIVSRGVVGRARTR